MKADNIPSMENRINNLMKQYAKNTDLNKMSADAGCALMEFTLDREFLEDIEWPKVFANAKEYHNKDLFCEYEPYAGHSLVRMNDDVIAYLGDALIKQDDGSYRLANDTNVPALEFKKESIAEDLSHEWIDSEKLLDKALQLFSEELVFENHSMIYVSDSRTVLLSDG